VTHLGAPAPPSPAWCRRRYGLACYSPRQLQLAYDLPPLYARGLDGRGRTIVLVDSFGSPTIRHDLRVFDAAFGLPGPPSLRIRQPVGPVPRYDPRDPDMAASASETTTDVECAHALAPGASIVLAETPVAETLRGGGFAAFMAAENYVVTHGLADVISQSFGIPEQNFPGRAAVARLRGAFRNAYRHHVTVLAAANDFGVTGPTAAGGQFRTRPVVDWPASDPLVTGVGGTSVRLSATGRRAAPDAGWNESGSPAVARYAGTLPWAGSGGVSAIFTRPGYQDGVRGVTGTRRGVPDVALSAAFNGASLTYESFTGGGGRWELAGGTSVATPYLAGVVAIADQYAGARLGLVNPVLYRLARAHAPGVVDVTRGGNTVSFVQRGRRVTVRGYAARAGYDLVTGMGTVDAARLILDPQGLAAAAGPGNAGPASAGPASAERGSGGPGGSCPPGLGGVRCALRAPG
jgi:subtilase family serine protease